MTHKSNTNNPVDFPKLETEMNERIKQLAEQAGMVRILNEHAHEYGNGTFENTPYPELEKFAELIVRECVGILESLPPGYRDYRDQIEDAFRVACVVEIKHKFGVE
jgi:hypothetical protein